MKKPEKRPRSKNARDMAKARDPGLQERLKELNAQVKDGTITKSQMISTYNHLVTQLLKDPSMDAIYTSMAEMDAAGRFGVREGSDSEASTSRRELQVVQYKYVHRHLGYVARFSRPSVK